jgi:thioredoxin-like negative regulator of GroEL
MIAEGKAARQARFAPIGEASDPIVIDNEAIGELKPGQGLATDYQAPDVSLAKSAKAKASGATGSPSGPTIVTISTGDRVDLKAHAEAKRYVIFDFYADWCGPCRRLTPELEAFARRHPAKVALKKIDIVRWGTPVSTQYSIRSIPHVRVLGPGGNQVYAGSGFGGLQMMKDQAAKESW